MPRAGRPTEPREGRAPRPSFVELPSGIFTAAGTWFHVALADLHSYAGPLLDRVPVAEVLAGAETVLRSPQTLATWVLLGTLLAATPAEAAITALLVFTGWSVIGPGMVFPGLLPGLRILETVWIQAAAFVAGLSFLGNAGEIPAVAVGLTGFVLLRWGVVSRLVEPVARKLRSGIFALPLSDQALRAVIIRLSLRERVPLAQIDAMEDRMLDIARRRPRGSSSGSDDD